MHPNRNTAKPQNATPETTMKHSGSKRQVRQRANCDNGLKARKPPGSWLKEKFFLDFPFHRKDAEKRTANERE
jgi:hypothetical protein